GGKGVSKREKLLSSKDPAERQAAAGALLAVGSSGDHVAEKLLAAASDPAVERTDAILRSLVALGPTAVPTLTRGLWTDDKQTRTTCLQALTAIGPDGRASAPSVAQLLADPSEEIRSGAAQALRAVSGPAATPALTRMLRDRDPTVRLRAVRELIVLGVDAGAVLPVLTAGLRHDVPLIQKVAAFL